jgi:hypothetical protein
MNMTDHDERKSQEAVERAMTRTDAAPLIASSRYERMEIQRILLA